MRRIRNGNFRGLARKKKLLSLIGAIVLGLFYSFYEPRGDVLQGTVVQVVDGDTVVVAVAGEKRRVRLIGVDTPETVHPRKPVQYYGKEASAFTKKNLQNKSVWLEYDVAPLDKYNRHLAYLWLAKPGKGEEAIRRDMFNAQLVLGGYGKVMTIQPNSKYADLFVKFQQEARTERRGLWQ
ncbi:MAG: thermonuclease family protein [Synergistaceae bacterium]|nr:thermonuclease family protein [Synergistaceae bacterium]